jgi:ABC-type dipeptide/oligopeptide/nickel transport system ATPase component
MSLLKIEDLKVYFSGGAAGKVIDGLFLEIPEGQITALVGGSGSGKTLTGLSILRLLPAGAKIVAGKIIFGNQDLLQLREDQMRAIRGKDIGMVFQEPLSALNPLFTVGYQISEVLRFHTELNRLQRKRQVLDLLEVVGIPDPPKIISDYPHQLSGGMRQRVMIAQAIAGNPKLVIADEPTSNLDVTLQAQIMELFRNLKKEMGITMLLITHDLAMVSHLADEVAVISGGRIVESGSAGKILQNPQAPFSKQLVEAANL